MPYTLLIRLPEVLRRTAMSRSSLYVLTARGGFPPPVKIGPKSSAWVESEVEAWIQSRIASSRPNGRGATAAR